MRRGILLTIFMVVGCFGKELDSEKEPGKLDSNLKKALLKALSELENENESSNQVSDKVTRASASVVSIVADSESTETSEEQQQSINSNEEPDNFLTSASNSFSSANKILHDKSERIIKKDIEENKLNNLPTSTKRIETTTTPTTTSTEENEAKVEDVQFFSAPLVAAFTVHQDESGIPKHVEPIYKNTATNQIQPVSNNNKVEIQNKVRPEQRIRQQIDLQEKQKSLEQEILKLKLIQQQQDLLLKQQLQKEALLQQELRLRDAGLQFHPINTEKPQITVTSTPKVKQTEIKPTSKPSSISFQQSIAVDPLVEAGKLPLNGQILPIRNANNFHARLIDTPTFQQFHSISQPSVQSITNFEPINFVTTRPNNFRDITFTTPPSIRVFRQEANTGNFFNSNNIPTFSIQKSVPQENRILTNNFASFNSPNSFSIVPSIETQPSYTINSFNSQPNHNRFFRSNYENTVYSTNNLNNITPQVVDRQLNNLLYNSGLIKGNDGEHLGIISKVLSLNHNNNLPPRLLNTVR